MTYIGFHSSIAGGVENAPIKAKKLNVNTFQMFLNAPRVWKYPELKQENILKFNNYCNEYSFNQKIVHLAYLPNPSSSDKELQKKSAESLGEAVRRCDILDIDGLVIHIGSHKGMGLETGMKNVIDIMDRVIELEPQVKLLLETSSGNPRFVGNKFDEIGTIIDSISDPSMMGVCFDTCHVYAAGYDIKNRCEEIIDEFDGAIGIERLNVIHANDSKGELGGQKDRHEHIGLGNIGLETFRILLNHSKLKNIPFIIETPNNEVRDDRGNLDVLRGLVK